MDKVIDNKLLILDDDKNLRQALAEDFIEKGYEVFQADSIKEIKTKHFDYAILDLRLSGEMGISAIKDLKEVNPNCKIVILTGYGSVASAVEAIKDGAVNYLHKPASSDLIESALRDELKENIHQVESVTTLNQHEHEYIEFVLAQNNGNITKTAKQLGLHRQSLQRKLKKFP